MRVLLGILLLLLAAAPPTTAAATDPAVGAAHAAEIETWRHDREARLRAPDGWLTLVGLAWLHQGKNRLGSAAGADVRLPASAPARAGTLDVDGEHVRASLAPGVAATVNGRPIDTRATRAGETRATRAGDTRAARAGDTRAGAGAFELRSDAGDAAPDVLRFGRVTVQVIARGGRLAARIKDPDSPTRLHFGGLAFYPIAAAYRVIARLDPAAGSAATVVVPDATGGRQQLTSPGTLAFTLQGAPVRLVAVHDGPDDGDLLIVFRDATTGRDTYGGGRFVRAHRQPDATYVIDFNQAYSPPCAFTPYATCPLPPPENRLPMAILAGEKAPAPHAPAARDSQ